MQRPETQRIQWFVDNHEKTRNTKNPIVFRHPCKDQKHKESNGLQTIMKRLKTKIIQWFIDNHEKTKNTKNPMDCRQR